MSADDEKSEKGDAEHDIPERWTISRAAETERKGSPGTPAPGEDASAADEPETPEPAPRPEPRTSRGPSRGELIDRSRSRAWALQIHYRWESGGGEGRLRDAMIETQSTRRIAKRRLEPIRRLVTTLDAHLAEVDAALEEAMENWRLERLPSIDRGVLRLGAAEILFIDDIPPKASIQEAVRLAESYGGDESARFVNGVLDAIYKRGRRD